MPQKASYLVQLSLLSYPISLSLPEHQVQSLVLPVKVEIIRLQEPSKGLVWRPCPQVLLETATSFSSITRVRLDSWYQRIKTLGLEDQTPMLLLDRMQEMELL